MSRTFPDHHLVTGRLLLRPYSVDDVDAILAAAGDELIQRWLPLPRPYTREDAVQWCTVQAPAARTGAGLARAVTRDGGLVGAIDLKRTDWAAGVTEIGYWAAPPTGFRTEGVARSSGYVHGGRVDLVVYSLIRSDLGLPT